MKTDYDNFAPRLGASYRPTDQTVVRAGFGVSYVPFVDNSYAYNYPIKTSTDYNNTPTYGSATLSSTSATPVDLATGLPPTPAVPIASNGTIAETGTTLNSLANLYIPLNFKNAYVTSWNVAVQQALPLDMALQIAYVANHGTRIDVAQNINEPTVFGEGANYDPLNLAFQKTASVTEYFLGFSTNYQSLQVQLTRRFNKDVGFTSAFTWGKAQNYQTGAQDGGLLYYAGPLRHNYAVADFDRKLNYEQTITYVLPAGRDQRFLRSGIGSYVLGGWRASAIISAVSGLPFTITTSSPTPGTTQTVNEIAPYEVTHTVSRAANLTWFNPASFTAPPACNFVVGSPCAFGNTQRNQFRGPAYFSDNLSLFKSFPFVRESAIEARADAFNLTNTPAFGQPNSTLGSNLGKISSTLGSGVGNVNGVGGPRVLQASLKITF